MPTRIKITIGEVTVYADLLDTACAQAIAKSLPIEARPTVWGDEFYFTIQVNMPLDETATTRIAVGDIGFWPPGNALAIFFGPTPLSSGPDPVPASEVNLVGKVIGDASALRKAKGASMIRIEKSSEQKEVRGQRSEVRNKYQRQNGFSLFTDFWSLLAAWHVLVNKRFLFCAVEGYEGMATP